MVYDLSYRDQPWLLSWRQWLVAIGTGAASTAVFYPFYWFISGWIGVAIFVTAVTIVHLHYATPFIVPFPHFAIFIAALQYVFAAWFGLYHPHENPNYFIGDRIREYYSYAGPVVLATALGWAASLIRFPRPAHTVFPSLGSAGLAELDMITLLGILALFAGNLVPIPGLKFVFVLLSNLRFVGVFGRMLVRGPGWQWRLALMLGLEVVFATDTAMFHNLLLWSLWTFGVWLYTFRPGWRMTLTALVVAVFLLPPLQEAKWRLRGDAPDILEDPQDLTELSRFDKTIRWLSFLGPSLEQTITLQLEESFLAEMAVRYNQGWIVNRVMQWVPDYEPFANGSTLISATEAGLLPRLVSAGKATSGGKENMERFAGIELNENTSMNLGYAGEMYANFGLTGGIIGCGAYALFFGLLFRIICRRAVTNPLWWSFVPYIFYAAVKAEDDIAFVLNWTVKGSLVLVGIVLFTPHIRRALFDRPVAAAHQPYFNPEGAVRS